MVFMIPFDGSELAEAALAKAKRYALALEELSRSGGRDLLTGEPPRIVAVSVVPENEQYARNNDWIEPGEAFRYRTVAQRLHRQVTDIAPSANFQTERVDRYALSGAIASRLRKKAEDIEATDLFIGSENAGHIVTSISSIGGSVAADHRYDVHLVRRTLSPTVQDRVRSKSYSYR